MRAGLVTRSALAVMAVVALLPTAAQAADTSYPVALPHMAFGGGWKTTFLVRNTGSAATDVDIQYFGDNGSALPVAINGVTSTHTTITVPANGQREVTPDAQGATPLWGWAALVYSYSDAAISAQAIFLWNNQTEAVAPVVSRLPPACIIPLPAVGSTFTMPFDNTDGKYSGYAFANSSAAPVTMDLKFFDESGLLVGEHTEALAAHGHIQFLVTDRVAQLKNTRGSMQVNGPGIVPLGFRFSPAGTFTTWLP